MSEILQGIAVLVIVFFMVIILGLQVQISSASRKLDEILTKLDSARPK
ncbi:MAG: hypothetical protein QGH42_12410 [Kiritimatiellia bacterium]|jgi:low affinity Fe/Cu permease|nr:hypothetical protein [Kiritimatiellia bacterium]MDP6630480.1 hypothetical protein [Kiritimatiellia bacterium]MDP6809937.1 hypothetical protein [Kiritimatiellia bacterium]MDP7025027.1 hypothetical protein [Kiritimatiellia bacterium]